MSPGNVLSANFLPEEIVARVSSLVPRSSSHESRAASDDIRRAVINLCDKITDIAPARETIHELIEETIIRKAISQKTSKRKIADQLNMSRMTLRKKMQKFGIE